MTPTYTIISTVTLVAAIITIIVGLITVVKMWRASGKLEGYFDTKIKEHQRWIEGHEGRIHNLEQRRYITHDEHAQESARCVQGIVKQIDENHGNLKDITRTIVDQEKERQQCRKEDNERWLKVENTLGCMQEFVDNYKRRSDRRKNN